jgi:hypothetical protein
MDDETKAKLDEAIKHRRYQMFPAERWLNVRGEEFTSEEARQALDFDDLIANYGPDIMTEDDDRIMRLTKDRCAEERKGDNTIILPGEFKI